MDLVLVLLLVLTVGAVVAVALGRLGGGLHDVQPELTPPLDRELRRPSDLDEARFAVALRGYRMDQVDDLLDETRDLLAAREAEIVRLRRLVPLEQAPDTPGSEPPPTSTRQASTPPTSTPSDPRPDEGGVG